MASNQRLDQFGHKGLGVALFGRHAQGEGDSLGDLTLGAGLLGHGVVVSQILEGVGQGELQARGVSLGQVLAHALQGRAATDAFGQHLDQHLTDRRLDVVPR